MSSVSFATRNSGLKLREDIAGPWVLIWKQNEPNFKLSERIKNISAKLYLARFFAYVAKSTLLAAATCVFPSFPFRVFNILIVNRKSKNINCFPSNTKTSMTRSTWFLLLFFFYRVYIYIFVKNQILTDFLI